MESEAIEAEKSGHHTILSDEEKAGLRLPLNFKDELNQAEALNISKAQSWALLRKRSISPKKILTEEWLKDLHKKMYGDVWSWAGTFRRSDKNIGVKWVQIPIEMKTLLDDANYWITDTSPSRLPPDQIAIQLSHRAVLIHPFPNGNGRWSRLLADVLLVGLDEKPFSWGSGSVLEDNDLRKSYIDALHDADYNYDYRALLAFARS
jgi:Fic-DOC domain mobile mystery protein B